MASQNVLSVQQLAFDQPLTGCWKLVAGRAMTLRPREDGVLRIAHGRLWVTLGREPVGAANDPGDHFLGAGQSLALQAGQPVVIEPWNSTGHAEPAYFSWDPMPAVAYAPVYQASTWQCAVVQPLADLRGALGLAAGAAARLARGLAVLALLPFVARGRLARAAALSAHSRA